MGDELLLQQQIAHTPENREDRPVRRKSFRTRRVFFCFLLLYLATWAGHYTSGDGAQKIQWARQIISGGPYWQDVTTGKPPKYGMGHTLVAIIPLFAAHAFQSLTGIHAEAAFYTLLFVINGAVLLFLVSRYLVRNGYPPASIWITVFVLGIATMWWPYTKLDFTEALVITFFFAGFELLGEGHELAGWLCAAFCVLLRTDSVLLLCLLFLWKLKRGVTSKEIKTFLMGTIPVLAVYVGANLGRYHSILDKGYAGESFSTSALVGLYGILFSAGKSIFLFSPGLILGLLGWRSFKHRMKEDAVLFLAVFVVQLLMYCKWWDWSGDDSWGVRFMIPGVMLMTIPAVEVVQRRVLTAAILVIGVLAQLPALVLPGLEYVVLVREVPLSRKALYVEGSNRIDFEDVRFNPRYSQLSGGYALVLKNLGFAPGESSKEFEARNGTSIATALRDVPVAAGCRWDIAWCKFVSPPRVAPNP